MTLVTAMDVTTIMELSTRPPVVEAARSKDSLAVQVIGVVERAASEEKERDDGDEEGWGQMIIDMCGTLPRSHTLTLIGRWRGAQNNWAWVAPLMT